MQKNCQLYLMLSVRAYLQATKSLNCLVNKKAHTDAVSVIALAVDIFVKTTIGTDAAEKVSKVPLSNDTISREVLR